MPSKQNPTASLLTQERLRDLLDYDPATGVFRWKRRRRQFESGSIAGTILSDGYREIMIDCRHYKAHRLAWFYVHGEWPNGDLDHKDTHRDHNWIDNLRPATDSQNHANQRRNSNNTSGFKGVSFESRSGKWRAAISADRRVIKLGRFSTPEEAHAAYMAKALELFGQYANDGSSV